MRVIERHSLRGVVENVRLPERTIGDIRFDHMPRGTAIYLAVELESAEAPCEKAFCVACGVI